VTEPKPTLLGKAPRARGKAPDAETKLQKDVCDLLISAGNAAQQMNNRFIKGVPDLLIKLAEYEAMLLECKLNRLEGQTGHVDINLEGTQYATLKRWDARGMPCGVLSFLHPKPRMSGAKRFRVFTFDEMTGMREFYKNRKGEEACRFRAGVSAYARYTTLTEVCIGIAMFAEGQRQRKADTAKRLLEGVA
jgi:hypothetical protein